MEQDFGSRSMDSTVCRWKVVVALNGEVHLVGSRASLKVTGTNNYDVQNRTPPLKTRRNCTRSPAVAVLTTKCRLGNTFEGQGHGLHAPCLIGAILHRFDHNT